MKLHRALSLRHAVLLLALLLGQWVTLAHASQHLALEQNDTLCVYCASGISTGPAAASSAINLVFATQALAPVLPLVRQTARLIIGPRRSQGPPALS